MAIPYLSPIFLGLVPGFLLLSLCFGGSYRTRTTNSEIPEAFEESCTGKEVVEPNSVPKTSIFHSSNKSQYYCLSSPKSFIDPCPVETLRTISLATATGMP